MTALSVSARHEIKFTRCSAARQVTDEYLCMSVKFSTAAISVLAVILGVLAFSTPSTRGALWVDLAFISAVVAVFVLLLVQIGQKLRDDFHSHARHELHGHGHVNDLPIQQRNPPDSMSRASHAIGFTSSDTGMCDVLTHSVWPW